MHLHLNPIGGLAGDMFCAALLDLRPELFAQLRPLLLRLQPPPALKIGLGLAAGPLHGRRFLVQLPPDAQPHSHSHYRVIRERLDQAQLPTAVRQRAQRIFRLLAEAEARVHGVEINQVRFHEVGNWDSLVDILSAAFLLEQLQIDSCSCEPLPRGGGTVMSQHGPLPVPAPATAYLLEGRQLRDDGIGGERVTPTGAAILRSLDPQPMPSGRLQATGYGFGSKTLEGLPNCLQAQLLDHATASRYQSDSVLELTFELDDQNPEDLAIGLERIRQLPGVLSLLRIDAVGKQGRPTWQIQILAEPDARDEVVDACFRQTRTLGLRQRLGPRWTLPRENRWLEVEGHGLQVKLSRGPDGWQAKAESRDLASAEGQQQRQHLAREAESRALSEIDAEQP